MQSQVLNTPLTVAEFFAGIGLTRMGLEACGWKTVFANDISVKKYSLYRDFFPGSSYIVDDVFNLAPHQIPQSLLATCSFPCVDLSLAGNMNGMSGKQSSAFWGFIKQIGKQGHDAPPLLLLENVPGWLYSSRGADFRITIQALNQLGYACDVFTLDALRFTPQSRLRVFLVAARREFVQDALGVNWKRSSSLLSAQLSKSLHANGDLNWFSLDLPEPPPLLRQGLGQVVESMDDDDPRWWSEAETQRHLEMMEPSHRRRVDFLAQRDEIAYRTFYRRRRKGQQRAEVRHDDIAGCLRTAVGGSGKQFLIRAGQRRIRMRTMTAREYARLQGVPDHYPIAVEGVQALTGFGDAVCVPAITWIAQHALQPLTERIVVTSPS